MGIRVTVLFVLITTIALLWNLHDTTTRALADNALSVAGNSALDWAHHGPHGMYIRTVLARAAWWGMGLLGGATIAGVMSTVTRVNEQRSAAGSKVVTDRFGAALFMKSEAMKYEMDVSPIAVAPVTLRVTGIDATKITQFERDAMGCIHAHGDIPADVDGHHGSTLLEHTINVWAQAAKRHGAGSIQALMAAAHDLGKVLSYKKIDGVWVKTNNRHEQLSVTVARLLPGFMHLEEPVRRSLISAMIATVSGWTPNDMGQDVKQAITDTRLADMSATAGEKLAKNWAQPSLLEPFVRSAIVKMLTTANINRSRDQSAPHDGIYVSGRHIIFVKIRTIRKYVSEQLPMDARISLRADKDPHSVSHDANEPIMRCLKATGMCLVTIDDVRSESGYYKIRSGRTMYDWIVAIPDSLAEETLQTIWGDWEYDVDVYPQSS